MRTILRFAAPLVLTAMAACSGTNYFTPVDARTSAQVGVLSSSPFDPLLVASDVDRNSGDAITPNLVSNDAQAMVHRCDIHAYETERLAAIEEARADTTRKTIPVRYAMSVGTLFDETAFFAHLRAVLRIDYGSTVPFDYPASLKQNGVANITAIAVAPANSLSEQDYNGSRSFHYFADHSQARTDFVNGAKCFFSTVKVVGQETGRGLYRKGSYNHGLNIMYYGDTYNANDPDVREGKVSPRLFKRVEEQDYANGDPQIVPLYMIDIRNQALKGASNQNVAFLNPDFASSAVRRQEYLLSYREMFDLKAISTHREALVQVLSSNRRLIAGSGNPLAPGAAVPAGATVYQMSAYEGVPQSIDTMMAIGQLEADMMSTQYTPIVLDLGEEHIRLSSVDWGTYFNLGAFQVRPASPGAPITGLSHQTAWLGGPVVQSPIANGVRDSIPRRIADDGFLVIPDSNGKVTSGRQLFGSLTQVSIDGKINTFTNGFHALAALAGKDCKSSDLKKQFVGPWDGELYAKTLKVWVDANRNGVSEAEEIQSLEDSRVGAIDACVTVEASAQDLFGNQTKLRAAFLYLDAGEKAVGNEAEILARLGAGKKADGSSAQFRVAIDVLFVTRPGVYLENIDPTDIFPPDMSAQLVQMAGPAMGLPPIREVSLPVVPPSGPRR